MKESKRFKESEIIGRMPNGDLYLKMGVRRKDYTREDMSLVNENPYVAGTTGEESYINYEALEASKNRELVRRMLGSEDLNDEIDNWDTE